MKPFKPPKSEEGYVLLSTIWLILLGASLVAAISLTVLSRSKENKLQRDSLERRLVLESAYETAVADILFNGPRSKFAELPASAQYELDGYAIEVSVSAESGKLDLNMAEPALIERAMRGLGVASGPRNIFLNQISLRRDANDNFDSIGDIEAELQKTGIALAGENTSTDGLCVPKFFTVNSGLGQPNAALAPPELARALNIASLQSGSALRPGSALQIRLSMKEEMPLTAIIRITGRLDQPISVLDWRREPVCD